jgi:hypothetical protein
MIYSGCYEGSVYPLDDLIVSSMGSCVHAIGKYAFNGLFPGNIDFNEDLTLQFSGVLMPPFLNVGYSRINRIAGPLLPEALEWEFGLRV